MALRHELRQRIVPLPGEEYCDNVGDTFVVSRVTDKAVYFSDGRVMLAEEWGRRRGEKKTGNPLALTRTKEHPASTYGA